MRWVKQRDQLEKEGLKWDESNRRRVESNMKHNRKLRRKYLEHYESEGKLPENGFKVRVIDSKDQPQREFDYNGKGKDPSEGRQESPSFKNPKRNNHGTHWSLPEKRINPKTSGLAQKNVKFSTHINEYQPEQDPKKPKDINILLDKSTGVIMFLEENQHLKDIDQTSMEGVRKELDDLRTRGKTIAQSQKVWQLMDGDSKVNFDKDGRPTPKTGEEEYWNNLEKQSLIKEDPNGHLYMSPTYWALLEGQSQKVQNPRSRQQSIYYQDFRNLEKDWEKKKPKSTRHVSLYLDDWQKLEKDYILVEHDTGQKVDNLQYGTNWKQMESDQLVVIDKKSGEMYRPSVYFQNIKKIIRSKYDSENEKKEDSEQEKIDNGPSKLPRSKMSPSFGTYEFPDLKKLESESVRLFDKRKSKYVDISLYEGDFKRMEKDGLLVHDRRSNTLHFPSVYFRDFKLLEEGDTLINANTGKEIDISLYDGDWKKMEMDGIVIRNRQGTRVRPSVYFDQWKLMERGPKAKKKSISDIELNPGDIARLERDFQKDRQAEKEWRHRLKSVYAKDFYLMEGKPEKNNDKSEKNKDMEISLYEANMKRMEMEGERRRKSKGRISFYGPDFYKMENKPKKKADDRQRSIYMGDWKRMESHRPKQSDNDFQRSIYYGDWMAMEGRQDSPNKRKADNRSVSLYGYDFRIFQEKSQARQRGQSRLSLTPSTLQILREARNKNRHSRISLRPSHLGFLKEDSQFYKDVAKSRNSKIYQTGGRIDEADPSSEGKLREGKISFDGENNFNTGGQQLSHLISKQPENADNKPSKNVFAESEIHREEEEDGVLPYPARERDPTESNGDFQRKLDIFEKRVSQTRNQNTKSQLSPRKKADEFEVSREGVEKDYKSDGNIFYLFDEISKIRELDNESNHFIRKMIMQPDVMRRSEKGGIGEDAKEHPDQSDSRVSCRDSEKKDEPTNPRRSFRRKTQPSLGGNAIKRIDTSFIEDQRELNPQNNQYIQVIEKFVSKNDLSLLLNNVILDPEEKLFVLQMNRNSGGKEDVPSKSILTEKQRISEPDTDKGLGLTPTTLDKHNSGSIQHHMSMDLSWNERKFTKKFKILNLSHLTEAQLKSFVQQKQKLDGTIFFQNNLVEVTDQLDPDVKKVFFVDEHKGPLQYEELFLIRNQGKLQSELLRESKFIRESRQPSIRQSPSPSFPDLNTIRDRLISKVDFVIEEEDYKEEGEIQEDKRKLGGGGSDETVKRFVTIYYNSPMISGQVDRSLVDIKEEEQSQRTKPSFLKTKKSGLSPHQSRLLSGTDQVTNHNSPGQTRVSGTLKKFPDLESPRKRKLTSPRASNHDIIMTSPRSKKSTNKNYQTGNLRKSRNTSRSRFFPPSKRTHRPISYKGGPKNGKKNRKFSPVRSPIKKKKIAFSPVRTYKRFSRSPTPKRGNPQDRIAKIQKYKQNYYDKHPQLYVEMMKRFERGGDDNSWNLEEPAFASYLPSNRDVPPVTSKRTVVKTPQRRQYQQQNPGETMNWGKTHPRPIKSERNLDSEPNIVPKNVQIQSEQVVRTDGIGNIGQKHVFSNPAISLKDGRVPSHGKIPSENSLPRDTGISKPGQVQSDNKDGFSQKEKHLNLHPLQFCNFCDNYFHEKCFNDYFQGKK